MGALSATGRSTNSRLGGRDPSCDRPSPQAGEFRLSRGPSWLTGRSKFLGGGPLGTVGVSGPFRSQFPKSRTFPSPCSYAGRRWTRSLPASETVSNPRGPEEWPIRSETRRCPPISGRGPFRVQSPNSRASGRSFSIRAVSALLMTHRRYKILTWFRYAHSNIPALKLGVIEFQRFFESLQRCKFGISKTFWFSLQFVFHNPYIRNGTALKKVLDITFGSIKRHITKMYRKRWLCGEWELLAS